MYQWERHPKACRPTVVDSQTRIKDTHMTPRRPSGMPAATLSTTPHLAQSDGVAMGSPTGWIGVPYAARAQLISKDEETVGGSGQPGCTCAVKPHPPEQAPWRRRPDTPRTSRTAQSDRVTVSSYVFEVGCEADVEPRLQRNLELRDRSSTPQRVHRLGFRREGSRSCGYAVLNVGGYIHAERKYHMSMYISPIPN